MRDMPTSNCDADRSAFIALSIKSPYSVKQLRAAFYMICRHVSVYPSWQAIYPPPVSFTRGSGV